MAVTGACPVCGADLRQVAHAGITIDACLKCRGLWFDASELERILELPGPVFHSSRLTYTDSAPTARRCPLGHGSMRSQEVLPGGFGYDRCPSCGGLWLDVDRILLLLEELGGPNVDDRELVGRLEEQVVQLQEAADKAWQDHQGEMISPGDAWTPDAAWFLLQLIPVIGDFLGLFYESVAKKSQQRPGDRASRRRRA